MQERLAAIVRGFSNQPPSSDYFRILSADLLEFGLPDLGTREGQAAIDAEVGDAEVLFIDNLSTLVRRGKENEGEGWLPVQEWALRHRRAGRSVVFLHHAGKGGAQRGTSRREAQSFIGSAPAWRYSGAGEETWSSCGQTAPQTEDGSGKSNAVSPGKGGKQPDIVGLVVQRRLRDRP